MQGRGRLCYLHSRALLTRLRHCQFTHFCQAAGQKESSVPVALLLLVLSQSIPDDELLFTKLSPRKDVLSNNDISIPVKNTRIIPFLCCHCRSSRQGGLRLSLTANR
ncbi:hypothetical protein EJ08DRAFT_32200 [Tothia fuscella]|uniref:Uncharacterized protein n=1 Tax=Tothia fuscella TaxID=1048955 RepID=A0A9P4TSE3_9PEZI|nr:hypothetical protein EJ08DRAFT_32200 [Tothia fuscella]